MGNSAPAANPAGVSSVGNLAISRDPGQTVVIGDGLVVIEVQKCRGDRTSLRISAPRELKIDRGEVHERRKVESAAMERIVYDAVQTANEKGTR